VTRVAGLVLSVAAGFLLVTSQSPTSPCRTYNTPCVTRRTRPCHPIQGFAATRPVSRLFLLIGTYGLAVGLYLSKDSPPRHAACAAQLHKPGPHSTRGSSAYVRPVPGDACTGYCGGRDGAGPRADGSGVPAEPAAAACARCLASGPSFPLALGDGGGKPAGRGVAVGARPRAVRAPASRGVGGSGGAPGRGPRGVIPRPARTLAPSRVRKEPTRPARLASRLDDPRRGVTPPCVVPGSGSGAYGCYFYCIVVSIIVISISISAVRHRRRGRTRGLPARRQAAVGHARGSAHHGRGAGRGAGRGLAAGTRTRSGHAADEGADQVAHVWPRHGCGHRVERGAASKVRMNIG
jgi:hypothetical protein